MNETNGGTAGSRLQETYLTVDEAAAYLKLAAQTIRKYVLNKSIPYRKVNTAVRFRLSEIEAWVDRGGGRPVVNETGWEGGLFGDIETGANGKAGEVEA